MKILVMGIGLNGGGFESVRYFAKQNCNVVATDLRGENELMPTIKKLAEFKNIKYVLGNHSIEDFKNADIVIKNPAVKRDSPFLQVAKRVETDLTIFLEKTVNPIIAVTGSKGKSTVVKAIEHIFKVNNLPIFLGGNITISPLAFIEDAVKNPSTPVILELSSWQLADIDFIEKSRGKPLLNPKISVITNIMNDHQNAYNYFEEYVADKKIVYKNSLENGLLITENSKYGTNFKKEHKGKTVFIDSVSDVVLPSKILIPGEHTKINLKFAYLCAREFDIPEAKIKEALSTFTGVPYRLEKIGAYKNITFYNDSAATMPDAMLSACKSFSTPIFLITGGTDKKLDITPFSELPQNVKWVSLLNGSLTKKICELENLKKSKIFDNMKDAFYATVENAILEKCATTVLLSPGAASFELFLNEFDRGDQFNALVKNLTEKNC